VLYDLVNIYDILREKIDEIASRSLRSPRNDVGFFLLDALFFFMQQRQNLRSALKRPCKINKLLKKYINI
jgi:hypothetical protein